MCELVSLVTIVSGYGLNDWEIEVRAPAEAKNFSSSLCVQTGSGALHIFKWLAYYLHLIMASFYRFVYSVNSFV
jgi:hypothetical protein